MSKPKDFLTEDRIIKIGNSGLYMFRDGTSVDFQSFTHLIGGDKWVGCDKGKDRVFGFLSTFSVYLLMMRMGCLWGSKSWLYLPFISSIFII